MTAIYVGLGDDQLAELRARHDTAKYAFFDIDLTALSNRDQLYAELSRTFAFPTPASGADATIDYLSDFEVGPGIVGCLFVAHVSATTKVAVAQALAEVLPAAIDRWRTQGFDFDAVFHGSAFNDNIAEVLDLANARLEAAAAFPWVSDTKTVAVFRETLGPAS